MTQKEMVLEYLDEFGEITPLEAYKDLGILRLAAVIFNLKQDGYAIKTETVTAKNRFGKLVTFAKYTVKGNE